MDAVAVVRSTGFDSRRRIDQYRAVVRQKADGRDSARPVLVAEATSMATDSPDGQDGIDYERIAREELVLNLRVYMDKELNPALYGILNEIESGESVEIEELRKLRNRMSELDRMVSESLRKLGEIEAEEAHAAMVPEHRRRRVCEMDEDC